MILSTPATTTTMSVRCVGLSATSYPRFLPSLGDFVGKLVVLVIVEDLVDKIFSELRVALNDFAGFSFMIFAIYAEADIVAGGYYVSHIFVKAV